MEDDYAHPYEDSIEKFTTYEDYLDSQITPQDRFYLEEDELARQLVEIGCRKGEVLTREDFAARREAAENAKKARLQSAPKVLASAQKKLTDFPVLRHLACREELVRSGKLSTIIFIRDKNHRGQEISGYIDYGHRLKTENFEPYFERKKRLLPKSSDLSFYNWDTQHSTSNESPNFQILPDHEQGLLFKNKRDRKVLSVDPRSEPGDNSKRLEAPCNRADNGELGAPPGTSSLDRLRSNGNKSPSETWKHAQPHLTNVTQRDSTKRRWLLACLVLVVAWHQSAEGLGFVGSFQADRDAQVAAIARRVYPASHSGKKLIIKLPKALGFQTMADVPKESVVQPLELTLKHQKLNYWELSKSGYNVSEVFIRFPGKTPWKRIGEVAHKEGDFREAISCQYNSLIRRAHYLYRKFRFWFQKSTPAQLGYTDTEGQIVAVDDGPPELGVEPQELKAMMRRSGFLPGRKPLHWVPTRAAVKGLYTSKKDHHRQKGWLMKRNFQQRIDAHKWWNPRKYRGRYMEVQTRKRGIVTGTGPSR
ncbi:cfap299 [Symbiodinium natans]|uniref:Cilia- and flagella-associated protein 299 n=1 Tax=Symbiodinium natans TaxID=878477 RepID=A0A812RSR6_9DINO|nr:cfap299 [Symbiodinium natans]